MTNQLDPQKIICPECLKVHLKTETCKCAPNEEPKVIENLEVYTQNPFDR